MTDAVRSDREAIVKTTDRVLAVVGLFHGDQVEWTVEEAGAALGLPVSTTYRYFKSLIQSGLIHAYTPGSYVLGPAIILLDRQMRLNDPLITSALPELERLSKLIGTQSVILLSRLYSDHVMCVHQQFTERPSFAVSYERGRLMPLDRGAASKVILANLGPRQLRTIRADGTGSGVHFTPALRAQLRQIRSDGYSITQGELDPGVRGISVPIFAPDGTIDGSLCVVVHDSRNDRDFLIETLIRGRKAIEANLAIKAARARSALEEGGQKKEVLF